MAKTVKKAQVPSNKKPKSGIQTGKVKDGLKAKTIKVSTVSDGEAIATAIHEGFLLLASVVSKHSKETQAILLDIADEIEHLREQSESDMENDLAIARDLIDDLRGQGYASPPEETEHDSGHGSVEEEEDMRDLSPLTDPLDVVENKFHPEANQEKLRLELSEDIADDLVGPPSDLDVVSDRHRAEDERHS